MADQLLDFRNSPLPTITRGAPIGRGWLFDLLYVGRIQTAIGDNIKQRIKVPGDEHWYILQWGVLENSATQAGGPLSNGWKSILMWQFLDRFFSPNALNGVPDGGAWNESSTAAPVWARFWDGSTYVQWAETALTGLLKPYCWQPVRASDPVFAFPRVGPGTIIEIESREAETATLGGVNVFNLSMQVIRFRTEAEDLKRLLREPGATLEMIQLDDIHEKAHRPHLTD